MPGSKSLDKSLNAGRPNFLSSVEERVGLDALRGLFNFKYCMN